MGDSFAGAARPLMQDGLAQACSALDVAPPVLWSVLSVETSGCGFLADRRPRILFERHKFSRHTGGRYDASHPAISNPAPGGYQSPSADQYVRLQEALALDRDAALQSASWGIGQIMGENFAAANCRSAEEMVGRMCAGEAEQLACMAAFILAAGLGAALRKRDWAGFAAGYNGPRFRENAYDTKLAAFYAQYAAGPLPDLRARAAQMFLMFRGYDVGPIDGVLGGRSVAALRKSQSDSGMAASGRLDDETWSKLSAAAG